jgi:hypothetical protein
MDSAARAIYEQAAQLNRYFLNWRHGLLAGYFAILYGAVSLAFQAHEKGLTGWIAPILLLTGIFGTGFFVAELRVRECYHLAASVAKRIELGNRQNHANTHLYFVMETTPKHWPKNWVGPHTFVTLTVYAISSVALVAASIYYFASWLRA